MYLQYKRFTCILSRSMRVKARVGVRVNVRLEVWDRLG